MADGGGGGIVHLTGFVTSRRRHGIFLLVLGLWTFSGFELGLFSCVFASPPDEEELVRISFVVAITYENW